MIGALSLVESSFLFRAILVFSWCATFLFSFFFFFFSSLFFFCGFHLHLGRQAHPQRQRAKGHCPVRSKPERENMKTLVFATVLLWTLASVAFAPVRADTTCLFPLLSTNFFSSFSLLLAFCVLLTIDNEIKKSHGTGQALYRQPNHPPQSGRWCLFSFFTFKKKKKKITSPKLTKTKKHRHTTSRPVSKSLPLQELSR